MAKRGTKDEDCEQNYSSGEDYSFQVFLPFLVFLFFECKNQRLERGKKTAARMLERKRERKREDEHGWGTLFLCSPWKEKEMLC